MFESLFDVTSISAIYTLYGSVLIALALKYFWNLHIEIAFVDSISTTTEISFQAGCLSNRENNNLLSFIIVWITKRIRKKISSNDDEDNIVYLQNYSLI